MLYQRTVLSGRPEDVIQADIDALRSEDQVTPDLVFRDPYLLDFLGLHEGFSEKDLESALVREMERFLLELGTGFSFVARQKRMTVDDEDFYLYLLFYHRKLRRLVAINLKLGKFTASYKGQMDRAVENRSLGETSCGRRNGQIRRPLSFLSPGGCFA